MFLSLVLKHVSVSEALKGTEQPEILESTEGSGFCASSGSSEQFSFPDTVIKVLALELSWRQ